MRLSHRNPWLSIILIGSIICSFIFGLAYAIRQIMHTNAIGADYYIYYMAGRTTLLEKVSPYDPGITLQTQIGILGHPATSDGDQLAFVYPAFALIPLFPLFLFDFSWSQAIWMAVNITLLSGLILTATPKPKISGLSYISIYQVAFSLILGNLNGTISLIVLFLTVHVFLFPKHSWKFQGLGGVLLAWAIIKPQFIWLYAIFFLITALRRKFFSFIFSFLISISMLVVISIFLWPHWIQEWISAAVNYSAYVKANFTLAASLDQIISPQFSRVIFGGAFLFCLAITVVIFRNTTRFTDTNSLIATLGWIGFVTYSFHPNGTSYEQLTMTVPFLLWFLLSKDNSNLVKSIVWISFIVLSWAAFYLTYKQIYPRSVYDLSLIFFSGWVLLLYKSPIKNFLSRKEGRLHAHL